jgi:hypothetical protein
MLRRGANTAAESGGRKPDLDYSGEVGLRHLIRETGQFSGPPNLEVPSAASAGIKADRENV